MGEEELGNWGPRAVVSAQGQSTGEHGIAYLCVLILASGSGGVGQGTGPPVSGHVCTGNGSAATWQQER